MDYTDDMPPVIATFWDAVGTWHIARFAAALWVTADAARRVAESLHQTRIALGALSPTLAMLASPGARGPRGPLG